MVSPELAAVQVLGERPAFSLNDLMGATGSRASAYRALAKLRQVGFAELVRPGYFIIRSGFFQPYPLWEHLLPSLRALKQARYFGRSYNKNDVEVARRILGGTITLDYRAFELTGLQEPYSLFVYVDDLDSAASALRRKGFWEGRRGRVALLPRAETPRNGIQGLYFDCLAYGGRSTLDAIAIECIYGEELDPRSRGLFRVEDVIRVRDGLTPHEPRARSSQNHTRAG
jgi:hypothetical protein